MLGKELDTEVVVSSVFTEIVKGRICGFGVDSYLLVLRGCFRRAPGD